MILFFGATACKKEVTPDPTPVETTQQAVVEPVVEEPPPEPSFCPEGTEEYNRHTYRWCSSKGVARGPFMVRNELGKVILEGEMDNGLMQGEWVSYYDDGKTRWRGTFLQGLEDGEIKGYDPQGTLRRAITFKKGQRHGKAYFYGSNSEKLAELEYTEGKPTGQWTYWHPNGQPYHQYSYKSNGKTSIHSHWDANGKKGSSPVGQLPKKQILPALEPLEDAIVTCYTHARVVDESSGKLVAQIHIGYIGEVSQVDIFSEDFHNPFLITCARREVEALSFPDNPYGPQKLLRTWQLSVE